VLWLLLNPPDRHAQICNVDSHLMRAARKEALIRTREKVMKLRSAAWSGILVLCFAASSGSTRSIPASPSSSDHTQQAQNSTAQPPPSPLISEEKAPAQPALVSKEKKKSLPAQPLRLSPESKFQQAGKQSQSGAVKEAKWVTVRWS
jgi:hypothetical protein